MPGCSSQNNRFRKNNINIKIFLSRLLGLLLCLLLIQLLVPDLDINFLLATTETTPPAHFWWIKKLDYLAG